MKSCMVVYILNAWKGIKDLLFKNVSILLLQGVLEAKSTIGVFDSLKSLKIVLMYLCLYFAKWALSEMEWG